MPGRTFDARAWARGAIGVSLTVLVSACTTQSGGGGAGDARPQTAGASAAAGAPSDPRYAAPPNYRQLVAQKMLESAGPGPVLNATISQPVERFTGIFNGGNRPLVCATIFQAGDVQPNHWSIIFEHGRIASAAARRSATFCPNVPEGPLPEAKRS